MKGRTITVPVVTGTCAFYLGKKVGHGSQWPVPMRRVGPQWHKGAARSRRPPVSLAVHLLKANAWRSSGLEECWYLSHKPRQGVCTAAGRMSIASLTPKPRRHAAHMLLPLLMPSAHPPGCRQASTRATDGRCTCAAQAARTCSTSSRRWAAMVSHWAAHDLCRPRPATPALRNCSSGCSSVSLIMMLQVTFVLHESFQNPRRDVEVSGICGSPCECDGAVERELPAVSFSAQALAWEGTAICSDARCQMLNTGQDLLS